MRPSKRDELQKGIRNNRHESTRNEYGALKEANRYGLRATFTYYKGTVR
jgi:hypothetical protein